MHTFRLWAPLPKTVEVSLAGQKSVPMTRVAGGWWTVTSAAEPGCEYGFILDGGPPLPDPRSQFQPHGIHGLSQLVDHNRFHWTDKGWQAPPLSSAIIYELHIGTFTPAGRFLSAIEKLDHLVKLGVTHVELMPVTEFSGHHNWGYDGVDLFAPHHAYGSSNDLKKLVDACHARGLAVILDVVYNHLGPTGNYLARYAPYFTTRYAPTWGAAINYDGAGSDEVRRFFCDNALMWLRDYHFDGLRLDAVHAIFDSSAVHFLEQLKCEVERLETELGRHFVLIPESDLNDPRLLRSREQGGYQLDAQWSDDFHHALHSVLTGERNGYYSDFGGLSDLAGALRHAFVYAGKYSPHRQRVHGRSTEGLSGHRFLGYLQNHDQIGNRAKGERSARLMSLGRLKIGAALVLMSPFVPMIFQGEEWGASTPFIFFTDHQEPELAGAVRAGRCQEFAAFGWKPEEVPDPQARETFDRSKLAWGEISQAPHAEILEWYQKLIRLRHAEPDLTDGCMGDVQIRFDEQKHWLTLKRGAIRLACNLSAQPQAVPLIAEQGTETSDRTVHLPPDCVCIFKHGIQVA